MSYPYFEESAVRLPGALWFKNSGFPQPTVLVQGDNFIMHRRSSDATMPAEKEVLQLTLFQRRETGIQKLKAQDATQIVLSAVQHDTAIVPVNILNCPTARLSLSPLSTDATQMFPPTDCVGIVPYGDGTSSDNEEDQIESNVYETNNTFSPRRTHKIKFTCRICGAINIKPINPYAWEHGSVFAKCGGCSITHKLIDNLKLFHELSGPVFSHPPPEYTIPDSLKLARDADHDDRPIDSLWLLDINPEIGFGGL